MKIPMLVLLSLICAAGASRSARASDSGSSATPELTRFFESAISGSASTVDSCGEDSDGPDGDWEFSSFRVAIEPYVTFGIPKFAGLTVTPRVELIWEKLDDGN